MRVYVYGICICCMYYMCLVIEFVCSQFQKKTYHPLPFLFFFFFCVIFSLLAITNTNRLVSLVKHQTSLNGPLLKSPSPKYQLSSMGPTLKHPKLMKQSALMNTAVRRVQYVRLPHSQIYLAPKIYTPARWMIVLLKNCHCDVKIVRRNRSCQMRVSIRKTCRTKFHRKHRACERNLNEA